MLRVLVLAVLVCTGAAADAQMPASKPRVPPGVDPGGIAIALVGNGLDYTDPEIARRLARDGEGEIIGMDLVDGDNRPYAPSGIATDASDGTRLAKLILSIYADARLVPVRIGFADQRTLSQAVGIVARTPARIVAILASDTLLEDGLQGRMRSARQVLFVVAASDATAVPGREPSLPEQDEGNVIRVAIAGGGSSPLPGRAGSADIWIRADEVSQPGTPAVDAVAIAAALAGCALHGREAQGGLQLRAVLLALAFGRGGLIGRECRLGARDR